MDAADKLQIILEKVPEEKQPDTALFLSGCFSLPRPFTRGIAASGPIAILSDLKKGQAEAVLQEMRSSVPEGVDLSVAVHGGRTGVSRLGWPQPPKIYGTPVAEFSAREDDAHDIKCPLCGGNIRITRSDAGVSAAIPGDRRRSDPFLRTGPAADADPLIAGIKPLAAETGKFTSLTSLKGGDTGWWRDQIHGDFTPPREEAPAAGSNHGRGGSSGGGKKTGSKSSSGLVPYMKPGAFAVIVGRTKDAPAVKMVASIMGIGENDARDKCLDLGVCVARDISLDEAQNLLTRFRNAGAKARIAKPS